MSTSQANTVSHIFTAQSTFDGDGVKLQRVAPDMEAGALDPFLLLDEFKAVSNDENSADIGGFPRHPHRGFETVTYLLEGSLTHQDTLGNTGTIEPGDVQWMTAGRGVEHSEIPAANGGRLHGFQLWVNLPAKAKFTAPVYREIKANQIPSVNSAESIVKVIAGQYQETTGPLLNTHAGASYFDVRLAGGNRFNWSAPLANNVFIYLYEGQANIAGQSINAQQLVALTAESSDVSADRHEIQLSLTAENSGAQFLVLSGSPFNEAIVNYGPFVMNSTAQIEQAINDHRHKVLTKRTSESEQLY